VPAAFRAAAQLDGTEDEVRPREPAHELRRVGGEAELLDDLVAHDRRGRRGACEHARVRKVGQHPADLEVLRAEVVPPLTDAVRLVHRHQRAGKLQQEGTEPLQRQPLGSDVEERELPGRRGIHPAADLPRGQRPREVRRGDAAGVQRADLVLHERDERRDDQRRPRQERSGELVGEALAAAGGRDEQHTPRPEQRLDRLPLPGAERLQPEPLKRAFQRLRRVHPSTPAPEVSKPRAGRSDDDGASSAEGRSLTPSTIAPA